MALDKSGSVVQLGRSLGDFLPEGAVGRHILDLFQVERPAIGDTPAIEGKEDWTLVSERRLWILKHQDSALRLKGAWQVYDQHALFLANMWVSSLDELSSLGLSIADFPIHELAGDHLLLLQQQATALKDMRELTQSLSGARDSAQEASKAKSSFLANMSHEIRTPMNGVIGLTEALQDTVLTEQQQVMVNTIQHSANHLMQIISDILDFSKVEAGEMQLLPVPTELPTLISEVVQIFEKAASEQMIAMELTVHPEIPDWVLVDGTRLRQVLFNLVSNAIKFTPEYGSVLVTALQRDDAIRIEIQDTGIGLSAEDQVRIFEPFKQADEGVSRGRTGTGLGLTICRHIVEAMSGTLEVDSAVGEGSCFSVTVSLPQCETPDAAPKRMGQTFSGQVLVVDDNPVNLMVAEKLLTKLGCDVDTVGSGIEAVERLSPTKRYDLVFMDCHMPGMDGFEATRLIRQKDETTPIVALTADVFAEAQQACYAAGMNDIVTKPIAMEAVCASLANYLQSAHFD